MRNYVKLLPAVPPITPSAKALKRLSLASLASGWLGRLSLKRFIKNMEVVGLEHLKPGSQLVLMNHSSALDPIILTFYGRKAFQFLVTEPYMADRKLARFAAWTGQIPKRKLDPDIRAIRTLDQWCKVGGTVATFPEGQFSWDGYPLPLMPGLADLIKYLNVPVVTARLINADRLWPAWAKHPRKTSLRLEVDPPKTFAAGEEIESYIVKRIHVDPNTCVRFPVEGKNLAEGLSRFLRFCFACKADQSLSDHGDELHCAQCKKIWQVTGENQLILKGSGENTSIAEAWAKIRKDLSSSWGASPKLLSLGEVAVLDASKLQWIEVTQGELSLQDGVLKVRSWELDLRSLMAHTMDWGDLILLRTERKRFALRFPDDSRAVWTFALDEALRGFQK